MRPAAISRLIRGEAYVESPYAADLELARRCAAGEPAAWERFVREYRPVLYRAADCARPEWRRRREIADALYAELYGVRDRAGDRGRCSATSGPQQPRDLAARGAVRSGIVDRLRAQRRLEPLPARTTTGRRRVGLHDRGEPADPDRGRYVALVTQGARPRRAATDAAGIACDLSYYYVQELTLAEIGRLLKEHEATVSRQLARTRRSVRAAVERDLRDDAGLTEAQIAECFASVADDPGPLDLQPLFARRARIANVGAFRMNRSMDDLLRDTLRARAADSAGLRRRRNGAPRSSTAR